MNKRNAFSIAHLNTIRSEKYRLKGCLRGDEAPGYIPQLYRDNPILRIIHPYVEEDLYAALLPTYIMMGTKVPTPHFLHPKLTGMVSLIGFIMGHHNPTYQPDWYEFDDSEELPVDLLCNATAGEFERYFSLSKEDILGYRSIDDETLFDIALQLNRVGCSRCLLSLYPEFIAPARSSTDTVLTFLSTLDSPAKMLRLIVKHFETFVGYQKIPPEARDSMAGCDTATTLPFLMLMAIDILCNDRKGIHLLEKEGFKGEVAMEHVGPWVLNKVISDLGLVGDDSLSLRDCFLSEVATKRSMV